MKQVTVVFIAADDADATAINAHLEQSGLLNEWPVWTWSTEGAELEQERWYRNEYKGGEE